ncbi:MAG: hypothetical protein L0338_37105 [Acidobacteria bacterium]|nr:hypothetical protein [Acidobacteriota bacterium]
MKETEAIVMAVVQIFVGRLQLLLARPVDVRYDRLSGKVPNGDGKDNGGNGSQSGCKAE